MLQFSLLLQADWARIDPDGRRALTLRFNALFWDSWELNQHELFRVCLLNFSPLLGKVMVLPSVSVSCIIVI